MKRVLFVACFLLLAGCSTNYPLTTSLQLHGDSRPSGGYDQGISAVLTGHDARKESAVVAYQLTQPPVLLPNDTEPHALITRQLAEGFMHQGLVFKSGAPIRIQLNIEELLADVRRPKILFTTTARSHITLLVTNQGSTLTKTYKREANRESATKPDLVDLEKMLNEQLSEIVGQILQDTEVRAAISKK